MQLVRVLLDAGIDVKPYFAPTTLGAWQGVMIQDPDFPKESVLIEVFRKAGLYGGSSKLLPSAMGIPGVPMDRPLLLVGERFPSLNPESFLFRNK
jgi:hypothetical protein